MDGVVVCSEVVDICSSDYSSRMHPPLGLERGRHLEKKRSRMTPGSRTLLEVECDDDRQIMIRPVIRQN
jgi:hypothetical protein